MKQEHPIARFIFFWFAETLSFRAGRKQTVLTFWKTLLSVAI